MKPHESVESFIVSWVAERVTPAGTGESPMTQETSLIGESLLDSLAFLDLVAEIETAYNVELDFSDADPEHFVTLGGLASLVGQARLRAA